MPLQAAPFTANLGFMPLPENAHRAVADSLIQCGFVNEAILDDYNFTGSNGDFKLNMLAFADPIRRTPAEYAGCTVYNASNGRAEREIVTILSQTAAPFHLIHRKDSFSFWVSSPEGKSINPLVLHEQISYDRIPQVLHDYKVDLAPERIVSVKQGRSQFVHPHLRPLEPLQLALWAIDVTRNRLVKHFGQTVSQLRTDLKRYQVEDLMITGLAIRMLGATILADTGVFGEDIRQQGIDLSLDRLSAIAKEHYPSYFRKFYNLTDHYYDHIQESYKNLRQIYYSGFVPDMLSALYTQAYSKEHRKKRGFYDTPLYLTRRILQNIPLEFLPPEQRIIVDMACGWGSFLIAGTERLAPLSDMRNRSLRQHIIGNDIDSFTAQLAGLGLLLSTSEDSWQIENHNALDWNGLRALNPGIIVGNPPFSGRRDRPESLDELMPAGKRKRVESANAHLEAAIHNLQVGGYLAMIMPRSFLGSEAGTTLRRELLESCDITEIWELPNQVFPDAAVQPMVLFARKEVAKRTTISTIRTRSIQKSSAEAFAKTGIFTASNITLEVPLPQSGAAKRATKAKNNYRLPISVILSELEWHILRKHCVNLEALVTIIPGITQGKKVENKRYLNHEQHTISYLTDARKVIPRSWYIDYAAAGKASYPGDFNEPRLKHQSILDAGKIIMVASPNPSWGRRAEAAVERKGYYVTNSFWVISPNQDIKPQLSLEALTAILNWYVSNAWIAEHRSYAWIERYTIKSIPIPHDLSQDDIQGLTIAAQALEQAAYAEQALPDEALQSIDDILRRAYHLDDATYERLKAIAAWDIEPRITLDPQADQSIANYVVSGVVETVIPEEGSISLWINGFDQRETVPIDPAMPGWMLRPGTSFRVQIPFKNKRFYSLDGVVWNGFVPQQYTYQNETELMLSLSQIFHSNGD